MSLPAYQHNPKSRTHQKRKKGTWIKPKPRKQRTLSKIRTQKNGKKKTAYLGVTDTEWETLDEIVNSLGYESRSDYLTACAHLTIYGNLLKNETEIDAETKLAIKKIRTLAEKIETQQKTFFKILSEKNMLPIISKRDAKTIVSSLKDDLEKEMLARCKMIPEVSQMEKWTELYKEICGAELLEFRIKTANTEVCL